MELMQALINRRAVRDYTAAPIERETLESLIDAAILAPSARNLQPWAFAVLRDRKRIDQCAARAGAWLLENQDVLQLGSLVEMVQKPGFSIFYHAPALVLVLATSATPQSAEDCCLAAQNLMLAARDQGLGTCWIGLGRAWLNLATTKAELGLPEHCHVVAPIVVGHPKSWPQPHGRTTPTLLWLDE